MEAMEAMWWPRTTPIQRKSAFIRGKGGGGQETPPHGRIKLNLDRPSDVYGSISSRTPWSHRGRHGSLPAGAFQPQNERNSAGLNQDSIPIQTPNSQSDTDTKNH